MHKFQFLTSFGISSEEMGEKEGNFDFSFLLAKKYGVPISRENGVVADTENTPKSRCEIV